MGVNVEGQQLHHLRFADDIVLITPSISQAVRMLAVYLSGTSISECSSYVYLGREVNMANDLRQSWAGGNEPLGEH
ncbi:unnamed protein product [Heligmosomoides polygyrus]|uniref:Reverse transcriptase domain-containing protein n=1 Tax=Heligmosomoides polygyrus TaxID=6339 RepID=A0A183FGR0_HELPZ|nr:unnamed protein product [Heligmosomoides polygyrus]